LALVSENDNTIRRTLNSASTGRRTVSPASVSRPAAPFARFPPLRWHGRFPQHMEHTWCAARFHPDWLFRQSNTSPDFPPLFLSLAGQAKDLLRATVRSRFCQAPPFFAPQSKFAQVKSSGNVQNGTLKTGKRSARQPVKQWRTSPKRVTTPEYARGKSPARSCPGHERGSGKRSNPASAFILPGAHLPRFPSRGDPDRRSPQNPPDHPCSGR